MKPRGGRLIFSLHTFWTLADTMTETQAQTHPQTQNQSPGRDGMLVSNNPVQVSDGFAFGFDIDGVLMKGGQPIPEGIQALRYINGENPYGIKVYVFFYSCFFSSLLQLMANTDQRTDRISLSRMAAANRKKNDVWISANNCNWTSTRANSSVATRP